MPPAKPVRNRLADLSRESGDCRVWIGCRDRCGYGKINYPGETLAHRVAYREYVGEIPGGYTIDHLCKNRACIRPEHLEAVTHAENVGRGDYKTNHRNGVKTHCRYGHPFNAANTIYERGAAGIARKCRACKRKRQIEIGRGRVK